jgi:8-oxo-dGTP pyrophosphatase MutT (NUDIX family)
MKSAAITIIFNNIRDEVLLIKRRDVPVWVLPGGGIEANESPENAAIREAFEETGLSVHITRKTGEYTPLNKLAALTHVYECEVIGGVIQTGDETSEIAFFSINNLPKSFFTVHEKWLEDALNNTSLVKRPINEVTYYKLFKYFLKHPAHVIRILLSRLGLPIN